MDRLKKVCNFSDAFSPLLNFIKILNTFSAIFIIGFSLTTLCLSCKNDGSAIRKSINLFLKNGQQLKARFKRRILHAPNRIAKLTACKMRRLNQLNATHFNSMRVSRILDWSSRICDWTSTVDLNAAFYMCRIAVIGVEPVVKYSFV